MSSSSSTRNKKDWSCTYCPYKGTSRTKLRHHEKVEHKTCKECNEIFKNVPQLRAHVTRVHGQEVIHECSYCKTTFPSNGY